MIIFMYFIILRILLMDTNVNIFSPGVIGFNLYIDDQDTSTSVTRNKRKSDHSNRVNNRYMNLSSVLNNFSTSFSLFKILK